MRKNIDVILEGLNQDRLNEAKSSKDGGLSGSGEGMAGDSEVKVSKKDIKKALDKFFGINERSREVIEAVVDEDEWKTMKGAHVLINTDGDIIAGGPESMRKKASKKEIEATKKNADEKSEKEAKEREEAGTAKAVNRALDYGHNRENIEYCKEHPEVARKAASILQKGIDKELEDEFPETRKLNGPTCRALVGLTDMSDEDFDKFMKDNYDISDDEREEFKKTVKSLGNARKEYLTSIQACDSASGDNVESVIIDSGKKYANLVKSMSKCLTSAEKSKASSDSNKLKKKMEGIKANLKTRKNSLSKDGLNVSPDELKKAVSDGVKELKSIKKKKGDYGTLSPRELAAKVFPDRSDVDIKELFRPSDRNFRNTVDSILMGHGEDTIKELYPDEEVQKAINNRIKELKALTDNTNKKYADSKVVSGEDYMGNIKKENYASGVGYVDYSIKYMKRDGIKNPEKVLIKQAMADLEKDIVDSAVAAEIDSMLDGTWGTDDDMNKGRYY